MRRTIPKQGRLFTAVVDDELADELEEVNALVALHPEWVEWILADLTGGSKVRRRRGREGMPPDQVLRLQFLKHRENVSLRHLARLVNNTLGFRQFLGLGLEEKAPKRSTMQENLAKVRPETWGRILHSLLQSQELSEFETGEKARIDATVVASNVHRPSDSSLLWDSVRVLTRLMRQARSLFVEVEFEDRSKQAKKLHSRIFWARKKEQRQPAYEALIEEARGVGEQAKLVGAALKRVVPRTLVEIAMCEALAADLKHYRSLMVRVIDQTERRVLRGEKVPAQEKLFSIFEAHTDMIVKSKNQPAEFGHKVTLTVGEHFVLDCVIERGNPGDVTLAVRQVERQKALFARAPEQVAMDGGYTSEKNLRDIKQLGTERCAFSKGRGLTPEDMAGSRRTYGRLRRFRAGIEGKISWLKRDFGLDRCTWKGWERFQSYVWSACFAANVSKLARLRLAERVDRGKRVA
jgi:IS5 family transposase